MKLKSIIFVGSVVYFASPVVPQERINIADSINRFSIDLLAATSHEGGESLNVALSPLTMWTILTVISEGALGTTASQLNKVLRQPQNKNAVKDSYQKLSKILQAKSSGAELETSNGIFTNVEFPVKSKFATLARQFYGSSITPVDFKTNHVEAAAAINKYVSQATKNRIPVLVSPADVQNAFLFVTSTMYFKGQWQTPFNKTATRSEDFLDDNKHIIGKVDMMYQSHPFAYARHDRLRADVLELPYGSDETFSMLVMVPRGTQTVTNMLSELQKESIADILAALKKNHQMFSEDDIEVFLPKFKIVSDFNLDRVLNNMGLRDIFDPQKANLLGIFPHYLYLSRVIQKAEIEVDEEGTVASAAGGATFINRITSPVMKINRPFLYFIVQKESGSIVFAGKLSNPNTLKM